MYAHDTTLYTVAKTIEQTIEVCALGTDAGSTLDWYRQNWLMVNLTKEAFHGILYIVANCSGNVRDISDLLFVPVPHGLPFLCTTVPELSLSKL